MSRIAQRFAALKQAGRKGLVTFITGGDPDFDRSLELLKGLPAAGADLIEIGVPFTDPMADGPAIQAANLRALKSGASLARTLELARRFRESDTTTPLVLMGYANPIHAFGSERFAQEARAAGVDGLIIVDLPPEEEGEFPALKGAGLDLIRLATPTTDASRLPRVVAGASGFLYYVAVAGITGAKSAGAEEITAAVTRIKAATQLPIAVGFGIKTPDQAATMAATPANAIVVGSAIVERIGRGETPADTLHFVSSLADAIRGAASCA